MASDGSVRITIEADGGKAIKSAKDLEQVFNGLSKTKGTDGINKNLDETATKGGKARVSIMDMAASMGLVKVASAAFNVLKDNVAGAVQRFDTLNRYPVVMKALGYSAKDTSKSMKILDKGIDGLPTALDEITASAQQFATLTGSATSGAKAAVALNDAFLASGASSADASRGMQQYTQMLSSGKVDMMSWRTLMETMPSSLDKVAKSFGFTGKSAKMDLYNALQSGQITIDQLNDRFVKLDGGVSGFASMAKKNSAGIGTSFINMSNSIKKGLANTLTAINDGLTNAGLPGIAQSFNGMKDIINAAFKSINQNVTSAIPPIINAIKGMVSFVQQNKDWLVPLTVGIGTAVAAFKGINKGIEIVQGFSKVTKILGDVKAGFSIVFDAVKAGQGVMEAFNLVLGVNPWILIVAAIAAVVAGLVWFFTQTKTGQKIVQDVTKAIQDAWQAVVDFLTPIFKAIGDAAKSIWDGVVDFASGVIYGVVQAWQNFITSIQPIIDAFKNLWSALSDFFSVLWQGILNLAVGIWNGLIAFMTPIVSAIMAIWNFVKPFFAALWNGIVVIVTAVWTVISTVISTALTVVMTIITTVMGVISAVWSTIWNVIVTVASTIWNIIVTAISTAINVIAGVIRAITAAIQGNWSGAWNAIKGVAMTIWNGIKSVISSAINGVRGVISSVLNGIRGVWSSVWNGIKGVASSIWNGIKSVISGAINGIKGVINGIKSVINGVKNTFNSIKEAMTAPIKAAKSVIDGIIGGIKDAIGGVGKAIGGIGKKLGFSLELNSGLNGDSVAGPQTENAAQPQMSSFSSPLGGLIDGVSTKLNRSSLTNNLKGLVGISAESASGANSAASVKTTVINNFYGSTDKRSNSDNSKEVSIAVSKLTEAADKLSKTRIQAIIDGSSFAPEYEKFGSVETAKRNRLNDRGLSLG